LAGGGVCTGTPVAPQTILTAGHCVDELLRSVVVDGVDTAVYEVLLDGNDHALIRTALAYSDWAVFGDLPVPGDKVHFFGNPMGLEDVYRLGDVAASQQIKGEPVYLLDVNVWHGDSGASIFDASGKVVMVVSGYYNFTNPLSGADFKLTYALPMHFTPEQWARADALYARAMGPCRCAFCAAGDQTPRPTVIATCPAPSSTTST